MCEALAWVGLDDEASPVQRRPESGASLRRRRGARGGERRFAKLHGAVGYAELARHYGAAELCGLLAMVAGLRTTDRPTSPRALLDDFRWERVTGADQVLRWTGSALVPLGVPLEVT